MLTVAKKQRVMNSTRSFKVLNTFTVRGQKPTSPRLSSQRLHDAMEYMFALAEAIVYEGVIRNQYITTLP